MLEVPKGPNVPRYEHGVQHGCARAGGRGIVPEALFNGPVDPSFQALSGRLKFTARRHKSNKESFSFQQCQRQCSRPDGPSWLPTKIHEVKHLGDHFRCHCQCILPDKPLEARKVRFFTCCSKNATFQVTICASHEVWPTSRGEGDPSVFKVGNPSKLVFLVRNTSF